MSVVHILLESMKRPPPLRTDSILARLSPARATTRVNTFQLSRFESQTKPMQECHPERELWISVRREIQSSRSELALERSEGMTKRDGLFFEIDWALMVARVLFPWLPPWRNTITAPTLPPLTAPHISGPRLVHGVTIRLSKNCPPSSSLYQQQKHWREPHPCCVPAPRPS